MTKRETLSYSQKQLYKQCKRKWYLRYKRGIEDTTKSDALIFGSYVHGILEKYMRKYHTNFASQSVNENDLRQTASEALLVLDGKLSGNFIVLGFDLALEGLLRLKKDFKSIYVYDDKPAIELELTIEDTYTGIIDLVYIDKKGKIVLLDWKTSSRAYTNHQIKTSSQLIGYAWLLENYGVVVDKLAYGVLHKKEYTASLLKVKHARNYRDLHNEIKKINTNIGYNVLLPVGKHFNFFCKESSNCFAYKTMCQFYDQCWGEDIRDVEVVE